VVVGLAAGCSDRAGWVVGEEGVDVVDEPSRGGTWAEETGMAASMATTVAAARAAAR
jgi:hypothetical protein